MQELLGADVMEAKRKGKVRKALQALGKGMMTLRQTVEHADVVSLHCSLKDDTLHLINDKTISYFKKGAVKSLLTGTPVQCGQPKQQYSGLGKQIHLWDGSTLWNQTQKPAKNVVYRV